MFPSVCPMHLLRTHRRYLYTRSMCYTAVAAERGVFQDSPHFNFLLYLYIFLLNLIQKYSFLGHIKNCQNRSFEQKTVNILVHCVTFTLIYFPPYSWRLKLLVQVIPIPFHCIVTKSDILLVILHLLPHLSPI